MCNNFNHQKSIHNLFSTAMTGYKLEINKGDVNSHTENLTAIQIESFITNNTNISQDNVWRLIHKHGYVKIFKEGKIFKISKEENKGEKV